MVSANSAESLATPNNSLRRRQLDQLRTQLQLTRSEMRRRSAEMRRRIGARDRQIGELSRKISEQDRTLGEQNRRIMEFDQRFDDVMAEVICVRNAEDLRIKQKCVAATDAPSTSSAGEISLPKPSTHLLGPESSSPVATTCDHPQLVFSTKSEARKRKRSLDVSQLKEDYNKETESTNKESRKRRGSLDIYHTKEKYSKNSESPSPTNDMRCLRSGRQMFCS